MKAIIYGVAALTFLTGPVAAISTNIEKASHLGYSSEKGPADCADLYEVLAPCKSGAEQSLINVVSGSGVEDDIETQYNYTPLDMTKNSHGVQVDHESESFKKPN